MKFPGPISIPELPVIDWSKYTSGTAESFQRRLGGGTRRKTQRQEPEESGGSGEGGGGGDGRTSQLFVRGRVYSESKPQVRQSYFISEKSPLILEINLLTFSSHRYHNSNEEINRFLKSFIIEGYVPFFGKFLAIFASWICIRILHAMQFGSRKSPIMRIRIHA